MTNDTTAVKVGKWFLYSFTLPWTLCVSYLYVGGAFCLYMATSLRMEEYGIMTAEWRPWVTKWWRYSTTVGRGIIYQPGIRRASPRTELNSIERHERVHVRQVEDRMLLTLIIGLVVGGVSGNWIMGFLIWFCGGLAQLPNFVTAWMRGGDVYRDSEHERSAYAQTDEQPGGGAWLDQRGRD